LNFISPLFLLGVLLVGLPILIHLWKRQVSRKVLFPSLVLLLRTQKKISRRLKIRNLLLLLLRSGLILLIPLALAQPYCASSEVSGVAQAVVIVLDDSFPMGYGPVGETLFDTAKARADELLSTLGPKDAAAIVLASAEASSPPELFDDLRKVSASLDTAKASFGVSSLHRSLLLADEALLSATQPLHRIVALTNGTQGAWDEAALSFVGSGAKLEVLDVAPLALPNRAILDVRISGATEIGPKSFKIDVTIANFSGSPVAELPIQITLEGKVAARGFIALGAAEKKTKSFFISPEGAGILHGEVTIEPDSLRADDAYSFLLVASREVRALLVNGDPKTVRYEDEAFFLEEALDATSAEATRVLSQTITVDGISQQDLSRFDVIALLNVGELGEVELLRVESFVKGGGGLVVSAGDELKRSVHALDSLLPVKIRDVFVASDGAFSGDQTPRRLAPAAQKHPIFQDFDPAAPGGISQARFGTILLFESSPFTDGKGVILSFDDGAPALIEGRLGQGRVLVFASTFDRSWTDLPVRPGFVPLVQNLFRYASDESAGSNASASLVGEPREISLPTSKGERLVLTSPSKEVRELVTGINEVRSEKITGLLQPGVWTLASLDKANKEVRRVAFSVVLDPEGSQLNKVNPAKLQKMMDDSGAGISAETNADVPRGAPLAPYLLLLVMGLLLGEAVLIRRG
jgi:hypothetical protein